MRSHSDYEEGYMYACFPSLQLKALSPTLRVYYNFAKLFWKDTRLLQTSRLIVRPPYRAASPSYYLSLILHSSSFPHHISNTISTHLLFLAPHLVAPECVLSVPTHTIRMSMINRYMYTCRLHCSHTYHLMNQ
jgi:hypothetical protein